MEGLRIIAVTLAAITLRTVALKAVTQPDSNLKAGTQLKLFEYSYETPNQYLISTQVLIMCPSLKYRVLV